MIHARRLGFVLLVAGCGRHGGGPDASPPATVTLAQCAVAWRPVADAVAEAPAPPVVVRPPTGDAGDARDPGTTELRPPKVVGGLDGAAVTRVLGKLRPRLDRCYDQRLASRPGLAGHVDLDFTIGPDGAVVSPSASGLDRELDGCLVRALGSMAFPKPRGGGAKVRVAVLFHPALEETPDEVPEELPEVVPETPAPPPDSVLASLAWADDGFDGALVAWVTERVSPTVSALAGELDGCAAGASGTARARLGVAGDGAVLDLEVGGLGSVEVEACIQDRLARIVIPAPPIAAAVTCDLTVGAPRTAQVTVHAGQLVIDVDPGGVRVAGALVDGGGLEVAVASARALDAGSALVVRVTGHADAAALAAVTGLLARRGDPYVVGVEDGGGGLTLVADGARRGAGRPRATVGPRPRLDLDGGRLIASIAGRGVVGSAALGDAPMVRAVLAEVATCQDCERVIDLAATPGVEARRLGEVAAWCAEVGLERIVLAAPAAAPGPAL